MRQSLTNSELSVFAEQMAMILHSGISSLEGISILCEDQPDGEGKNILQDVFHTLEQTGELAEALRKTNVYPEYFIKMTEVGERSGTLEEVMASLAEYYRRQDALIRSIREALIYPLILMVMLFAVLTVLITRVMPVFSEVFEQLGLEISGISSAVFRLSSVLQRISAVFIALIVLLVAAALAAIRSEKGKAAVLHAVLLLPIGRTVSAQMACSRFSDALALALHSGLDMGESFELASSLVSDKTFARKTAAASKAMEEGQELSDALRKSGVFTGLNARMVSVSFYTGTAETALKRISADCQMEAENRVQNGVAMLEPTLTAVLSLLTGLILVSVMLPLLSVMSTIG